MTKNTVLVVGGCGCVGFHIVKALLEDAAYWTVHVISRNPSKNKLDGVQYHAGDIGSLQEIRLLFDAIRPHVVVHAASPIAAGNTSDAASFVRTNVKGTENLLECSVLIGSVSAFVYTSSVSVMAGSIFHFTEETAPVLTRASQGNLYGKSKALAESLVLATNGEAGVRTISLRLASVYGERDNQLIPGALEVLRTGQHLYQIGDNSNLFDVVSTQNVAAAHLLAIKGLLSESELRSPGVDGEAFFITDGDPPQFWDFQRRIWAAAGDRTRLEEIKILPAWFMLSLASTLEWVYLVFTLGQKRPSIFQRHNLEYTCLHKTFSIDKARRLLGYKPVDTRDEHIKSGVAWALQKQPETLHIKDS